MHYSANGYAPQTGYAAPVYGTGGYPSYAAALTQGAASSYPFSYSAPFSYAAPIPAMKPVLPQTTLPQTTPIASPMLTSQPVTFPQASAATAQPALVGAAVTEVGKKPNPQRFATPAASSGGKQQWPPNLKAFVEKTFAQCRDEADRSFADAELRKRIAKVASDARLSVHKWELEYITLPSQQKLDTEVSLVEETVSTPKKRKSRFDIAPEDAPSVSEPAGGVVPEKRFKSIEELNVFDEKERASRDKRADRCSRDAAHHRKPVDASRHKKAEAPASAASVKGALTDEELEALMVVGTCENPEKEYFRLTSAPDPSTVRPERVLRQALANLQEKWREKS